MLFVFRKPLSSDQLGEGRWPIPVEAVVVPSSGALRVTKFTIGYDCGKIIHPGQLDLCMKSGVVMGLSEESQPARELHS